jgi:hypothetical protein
MTATSTLSLKMKPLAAKLPTFSMLALAAPAQLCRSKSVPNNLLWPHPQPKVVGGAG